jgi:hypothetical protein
MKGYKGFNKDLKCRDKQYAIGRIKGGKGSVLVLVNRDDDSNIIDFAASAVDGDIILPDTWYRLKEGKFVEAEKTGGTEQTES